ncbi:MAG: hypothetical protein RMK84_08265 [Oscillochloridaceae bacterium]|nr:hypothetical protein [Chloroflexaceae bacterium]MDW8390106.1 hypothetical protein [Oscillochloridaceae bacterium]
MPVELRNPPDLTEGQARPTVVNGELRCALTGVPVSPDEAYWAPPLITARQLITTVITTLFTAPGALGQVLFGELPNVPYAPAAREQLATRRTVEQLKLLGLILLLGALMVVPIVLLSS